MALSMHSTDSQESMVSRHTYIHTYILFRLCQRSVIISSQDDKMLCFICRRTEGEWLKRLANYSGSMATSAEELTFQKSLATACLKLLKELGIMLNISHF